MDEVSIVQYLRGYLDACALASDPAILAGKRADGIFWAEISCEGGPSLAFPVSIGCQSEMRLRLRKGAAAFVGLAAW